MTSLADLPGVSRIFLYVLLAVTSLVTVIVLFAQIGCLRGKPFENPDGTRDDWREQKVFYGIAWADILVACPVSFAAIVLVFLEPRLGFLLMGMVSFWFVWANVMTTATSLRFEKPQLTPHWFVVFPMGTVIGLAFLVWIGLHFRIIFGP